jgi:DNA-binding MarR family transcriptional regulator
MEQPDPIIHQPVRLRIMAALTGLPRGERVEFVRLKTLVQATEGNLGAHIGTLENTGYIRVEKDFNGRKPRTRISLTDAGRRAFGDYVAFLRAILEQDGSTAREGVLNHDH